MLDFHPALRLSTHLDLRHVQGRERKVETEIVLKTDEGATDLRFRRFFWRIQKYLSTDRDVARGRGRRAFSGGRGHIAKYGWLDIRIGRNKRGIQVRGLDESKHSVPNSDVAREIGPGPRGYRRRTGSASWSSGDDGGLLGGLGDGGVDVEGASKPDDAEKKEEDNRQYERGFGDFGAFGSTQSLDEVLHRSLRILDSPAKKGNSRFLALLGMTKSLENHTLPKALPTA